MFTSESLPQIEVYKVDLQFLFHFNFTTLWKKNFNELWKEIRNSLSKR